MIGIYLGYTVKSIFIVFSILFFFQPAILATEKSQKSPSQKDLTFSDVSPEAFEYSVGDDFLESLKWAYQGSYKQFQGTQNLVFAAMTVVASAYFIYNDDRISQKTVDKKTNEKIFSTISDSSIFFNSPILPFIFYGIGVSNKDSHMVQFSKEYFATLGLTLIESAAISAIPVHQRPDQKELSFWEKAFRGQSSFPSGHVVGYTVLGFKSLQFYGPHYALLPFVLATATAFERVHTEKHYMSDVVASGFLSLLASEGVRYAAGYNKNHKIYKWIFEHDFSINYIRNEGSPGIQISLSY